MWDPTPRKTVHIPVTSAQTTDSNTHHRKHLHFIHKANTIGIPSESELADSNENTAHNHKRRNFLGIGFRNTLRSKHKSDPAVLESPKEGDKSDVQRRWSEAHHQPTVIISCLCFFLNNMWC